MFDVEKAIHTKLSERTDEEKEQWRLFQEEQRSKLVLSDANSIYGERAIRIAEDALKKPDCDEDFEFTRMAEGYALCGDFETAAVLTRNEEKRTEYKKILDALANPDCNCPPTQRFGTATVPTRFPKLQFGNKQLTECSICHNWTVINA